MRNTLLALSLLILAACSPSDQAIQETIDTTSTAAATLLPPATDTPVPPTETLVPTETLDAFEQMLAENLTQNASYELTASAFGTNIALAPSNTPSITPTATPHDNPGLIGSLGGKPSAPWWTAIPAFSPNGKMVALVSARVTLWNLETREIKFELATPYPLCDADNISFSGDSRLLAASVSCTSDIYIGGHLLVWDTKNGALLQDRVQDSADTENLSEYSKFTFATGFAFLPASSMMAVASAKTIEFRDARQSTQSVQVLDLGEEMVATDISISDDGNLLFAFMDYYSDHGFNSIGTINTLQVRDLGTLELQDEIAWPESKPTDWYFDHYRNLSGQFLLHLDRINEVFTISDLVTQEQRVFHLGTGKRFISPDGKYLLFIPADLEHDCNARDMHLLKTESGQIIYTFNTSQTDFYRLWCGRPQIAFNQENTMLAMGHNERLSLWDISAVVNGQE
jgi:WD40 repeat protein